MSMFGRTKTMVRKIDDFCDKVSQGGLAMREAVKAYLTGDMETFNAKHMYVNGMESEADSLRREIERQLYEEMLIPDARGDVLGLLENMDSVLNECEGALWGIATEQPEIPADLIADYERLSEAVSQALEQMVCASRTFFRDSDSVHEYLHKVLYYEKEADKIASRLKREIFSSTEMDLAHKLHLRDHVRGIDDIANIAEDVADRLAIYAIKRSI